MDCFRICKEHPTKKWNKVSVQRLLKRFQEHGSMDRRPGSGRPRTSTTAENEQIVEELIFSQEDRPGTHSSPREIEKHTGIDRSAVRRMVKRKGLSGWRLPEWMIAPLHTVQTLCKICWRKNLANVSLRVMNGPLHHLTVIPLITIFGTRLNWKFKVTGSIKYSKMKMS